MIIELHDENVSLKSNQEELRDRTTSVLIPNLDSR